MADRGPGSKSASDTGGGREQKKLKRRCTFKTQRKLGGLNLSLCRNTSLNSSVMKRTLSSNNRALARALEMKKAELNAAIERITALRTENHALLAEVNRLKSYDGTGREMREQEINERVEEKLVPMRLTLQQMGTCMMTQVNHIQALMKLCECSKMSLSTQPSSVGAVVDTVTSVIKQSTSQKRETSEARFNPAPMSTLTTKVASRVPAHTIVVDEEEEEDDNDDEYEDEVVYLQQKSDTPDDKIPIGLGRTCNLSMIMEQSYNDLELTICGGNESLRESSSSAQRRSSRRKAMVFHMAEEDDDEEEENEDDACADARSNEEDAVMPKRVTRARSKTSSKTRGRSEVFVDLSTVQPLDVAPSHEVEVLPAEDINSIKPSASKVVKSIEGFEKRSESAAIVSIDAVRAIDTEMRIVPEKMDELIGPQVRKVNSEHEKKKEIANLQPVSSTDTCLVVEVKQGLTRRDIPTFVSLDDDVSTINSSRHSTKVANHGAGVGAARSKESTKKRGNKKTNKTIENASYIHHHSSENTKTPLALLEKADTHKNDEIPTTRGRRMTFVVSDEVGKHAEQVASSSPEKTPMDDTLACMNDLLGEDLMNQSATLLLDVSGCHGIDDSTIKKMFPTEDELQSARYSHDLDRSGVECDEIPIAIATQSETHTTVIDMEMTSVLQNTIHVINNDGEVVNDPTIGDVTVTCKADLHEEKQRYHKPSKNDMPQKKAPLLSKSRKSSSKPTDQACEVEAVNHKTAPEYTDKKDKSKRTSSNVVNRHLPIAESDTNVNHMPGNAEDELAKSTDVSTSASLKSDDVRTQEVAAKSKKIVAAFMSKPGKIVFNAKQRRSPTDYVNNIKQVRSKSRSTLPLHSRPRSKQLLGTGNTAETSESPTSVFSFDGTPKEEADNRRKAASKHCAELLDDSFMPPPAKTKPVHSRQQAASYATNVDKIYRTASITSLASQSSTFSATDEDDISSSPHGIMLVLANGQRTKPRRARSKTVRIANSDVIHLPTHVQAQPTPNPFTGATDPSTNCSVVPSTPVTSVHVLSDDAGGMQSEIPQNVRYSIPESPFQSYSPSFRLPVRTSTLSTAVSNEIDLHDEEEVSNTPIVQDKFSHLNDSLLLRSSLESHAAALPDTDSAKDSVQSSIITKTGGLLSSKPSQSTKVDLAFCPDDAGQAASLENRKKMKRKQTSTAEKNVKCVKSNDEELMAHSKQQIPAHCDSLVNLKRKKTRYSAIADDDYSDDDVFCGPKAKVPSPGQLEQHVNKDSCLEFPKHPEEKVEQALPEANDENIEPDDYLAQPEPRRRIDLTGSHVTGKAAESDVHLQDARASKQRTSFKALGHRQKTKVVASSKSNAEQQSEHASIAAVKEKHEISAEAGEDVRTVMKTSQQNRLSNALPARLSHDGTEGPRSRRAAAVVSYKEPSLGSKLRQGDKFTCSIYKGNEDDKKPQDQVCVSQSSEENTKKRYSKDLATLPRHSTSRVPDSKDVAARSRLSTTTSRLSGCQLTKLGTKLNH